VRPVLREPRESCHADFLSSLAEAEARDATPFGQGVWSELTARCNNNGPSPEGRRAYGGVLTRVGHCRDGCGIRAPTSPGNDFAPSDISSRGQGIWSQLDTPGAFTVPSAEAWRVSRRPSQAMSTTTFALSGRAGAASLEASDPSGPLPFSRGISGELTARDKYNEPSPEGRRAFGGVLTRVGSGKPT
jgi:hypothetical protein